MMIFWVQHEQVKWFVNASDFHADRQPCRGPGHGSSIPYPLYFPFKVQHLILTTPHRKDLYINSLFWAWNWSIKIIHLPMLIFWSALPEHSLVRVVVQQIQFSGSPFWTLKLTRLKEASLVSWTGNIRNTHVIDFKESWICSMNVVFGALLWPIQQNCTRDDVVI